MTSWSNGEGSKQSSVGVSLTAETYRGKHGLSLKLDGLEPGFNEHNRERAIVIHGASYASEAFAKKQGRLGNSWGCPAVSQEVSGALIETIKNGTVFVSWYPDEGWRSRSVYVSN